MKKKIGAITLALALMMISSGCTAEQSIEEAEGSLTLAIPNPPENTNHGYLLEDDRIPTISNCDEWADFWIYGGPAVSFEAAESAMDDQIAVSTQIYLKNQALDQNKDGIICFFENEVEGNQPATVISDGSSLLPLDQCRIDQANPEGQVTRAGFPQHPDYVLPDDRRVVIQLVYVDAEDNRNSATPSEDANFWIDGAGGFLEAVTDNRIAFEWRFENRYFRLPQEFGRYGVTRAKQGDPVAFVQAAITASDNQIDYSDVDMVVVVPPSTITSEQIDYSPALPMTKSSAFRTKEGKVYRATLAGSDTRWERGYLLIAHEIGHLLGIQDYYAHEWRPEDPYERQHRFMGEFDNMGFAPGKALEWTTWSRWLISTLQDSEVRCVDGSSESTHQLFGLATMEAGPKMAVVPTSRTKAIVIESRKRLRQDINLPRENEGLLVYRVDTYKQNGSGPLRIVKKSGIKDVLLIDAPLRPGEHVVVDGYRIENVEAGRLWDVVKVAPTGD